MIDLFVTHYSTPELAHLDEMTVETIANIRRVTPMLVQGSARLSVVYWVPPENDSAWRDRMIPATPHLIRNERPGRASCQPSVRNRVVDEARARGSEAFVLLHNDITPHPGWLEALVDDWHAAEKTYGIDRAAVSPILVESSYLPPASPVDPTDDGTNLVMFIASPRYFERVGPCDEEMFGIWYDDVDWGMRALLAGQRHLRSHRSQITHAVRGTFRDVYKKLKGTDPLQTQNERVFLKKWGRDVLIEANARTLFPRLHREQS